MKAVDKLHGTNVCIHLENGVLTGIDNRKTRVIINPFISIYLPRNIARMLEGVINSISAGFLKERETCSIFGEMIGPHLNGNIHGVDRPYFIPFDTLEKGYHWRSWVQNDYPKTFESISSWFKELPSLFTQKKGSGNHLAEGLIFLHPDGRRAKLRRDMFDWYEGPKH